MTPALRDRYLAKLRRLGQLSFEERLETLFDAGTCRLVNAADWDEAWTKAVITAEGEVEGRKVLAYATHFGVQEGTIGRVEADDIVELLDRADAERLPVVSLLHSNGARVSERYESLAGNARLFKTVCRLSGAVPQLAGCMNLCLGVAAYLASLADQAWMVKDHSYAATTSPAVIKAATGQPTTLEELGGAAMHAGTSGMAHHLADSEEECLLGIRRLLGYLGPEPAETQEPAVVDIEALVPSSPYVPYDVRDLIRAVVDRESFLEVHAGWATNLVTGFARLDGRAVALVANQSKVKSGTLDVAACRKASRFVQTADSYGLPLVYLVDVPGIMVSPQEEQAGILDAGGVFFHAVDTDVPRVSLVVRKCFGGAFVMLQARQADGDRVLAYPKAEIGIAGAQATFTILHGKEVLTHEDAGSFKQEALEAIRRIPSDAYAAQEVGIVDRVISPRHTRRELVTALAEVGRPHRDRPLRRHPNIQV